MLCAKGDDLCTLKKILSYVLELAQCDLNYDIRDRARVLKKLLSCYIGSHELEEESKCQSENKNLSCLLAERIFGEQQKLMSTEPTNYRFYLPGSLSQIVLHAAPGYDPLPEPCSLTRDDNSFCSNITGGVTHSDSYEVDHPERALGSLDEESSSSYGSQVSETGSSGSYESGSASEGDNKTGSFINFSDVGNSAYENHNGNLEVHNAQSSSNDFGELMSKRALESWLDENPGSSQNASRPSSLQRSSARISIGGISERVKPKSHTLLDPANGNGLRVDYIFSSEISNRSHFVCIEVSFTNCSTEPISKLFLCDEEMKGSQNNSDKALTANDR